jgi:hypothetical protein
MTNFALGEYFYFLGSRELLRVEDFTTGPKSKFDKWESTMKQVAKDAVYQASSLDEFCSLIKARAPGDLKNLQCKASIGRDDFTFKTSSEMYLKFYSGNLMVTLWT